MNSIVPKMMSVLLGLFTLSYIAYQVYHYASRPYITETAVPYSVAESLTLEGVAVRNEQLIEGQPSSGVLRYIYDDASRVAADSSVAQIFSSRENVDSQNAVAQLDSQIAQLRKAQEQGKRMNPHADALSSQIIEEQSRIIRLAGGKMMEGIEKEKLELTSLMNSKMISLEQEKDFQSLITQMEAEKEYEQRSHSGPVGSISAPVGGYFVKNTDGLEGSIGVDVLQEMDYQKFQELMELPAQEAPRAIGKIVTDHVWYFVVSVTDRELEKFTDLESVQLDFKLSETPVIDGEIYQIITQRPDKNLVVFKCKNVTDELMNLRHETVEVIFRYYSGYRVSTDAIRFVDGQECVYVVDYYQMRLTPIYPVYRQSSFVICDPNAAPPAPVAEDGEETEDSWLTQRKLKMFDEIIVEGTELYDGKTIGN